MVWFFFLVFTLLLSACTPAQVNIPVETGSPVIVAENTVEPTHPLETSPAATLPSVDIDEIIEYEMKGSFDDYFWGTSQYGYGQPRIWADPRSYPGSEGIASIAAVGVWINLRIWWE